MLEAWTGSQGLHRRIAKPLDVSIRAASNSDLAVGPHLHRRQTAQFQLLLARLPSPMRWLAGLLLLGLCSLQAPVFAQSSDAALMETLRTGKDPEARRQAAVRLSKVDAVTALEPLMAALLADRSPIVRTACAEALGTIGSPAALSALRAATRDEDVGVKQKVEAALARINKLAAEPVEKMVVLVSAPAGKASAKSSPAGLPQRLREQFVRELRLSPDVDVRDDFKPSGSETAFSIEGTISNMSRRTTSRGELEVSYDINVVISQMPGKRVVGIVTGGASTFSPKNSAGRLSKNQIDDLEQQALSQSVLAATENVLSFLRGQRKSRTY